MANRLDVEKQLLASSIGLDLQPACFIGLDVPGPNSFRRAGDWGSVDWGLDVLGPNSFLPGDDRRGVGFLKVPVDQRRANAEAYDPLLFSFGPYHHHHIHPAAAPAPPFVACAALADGQHLKLKVAETVLEEGGCRRIADQIKERHGNIGNLYVQMSHIEPINIDDEELARLLAVDGTTLVQAMREAKRADALMAYPIVRLVLVDSVLLENQLPIFVLDYALQHLKAEPSRTPTPTLGQVLCWYCECLNPFPFFCCPELPPLSSNMEEPLLSYIYDFLTQLAGERAAHADEKDNYSHKESSAFYRPSLPTASHLLRCGVRFKPIKEAGFSGIRMDANSMQLKLPIIVVGDTTVRFLHNLLAYEATSRYPHQFSVISYVYFMDRLIDTREDVQVLVNAGVLCNTLGSDQELANCWNKLCISVSYRATKKDQEIMARLDMLAKKRWRRWMAAFKEKYWEKQPWLLVSIVAALVLLVLTCLQTIYTIKGRT